MHAPRGQRTVRAEDRASPRAAPADLPGELCALAGNRMSDQGGTPYQGQPVSCPPNDPTLQTLIAPNLLEQCVSNAEHLAPDGFPVRSRPQACPLLSLATEERTHIPHLLRALGLPATVPLSRSARHLGIPTTDPQLSHQKTRPDAHDTLTAVMRQAPTQTPCFLAVLGQQVPSSILGKRAGL